ncbi:hypothetical protein [Streptomyces sp. SAJ15]|uniref:hypothetical protein n=1 Tax=Streptomyces sp. SAJ15 TaxID=2011095 RepID=UPI00118484C0|nr:hypothetical protein [Streptomyces sp. SAJ15]TVL89769.1 hypothetical protein CD790_25570 [Streptomyces sp. SAJ15]
MNITIDRRGRAQKAAKARLQEIADRAGQLVTGPLGGRLPHTDFVLTDAAGVASIAEDIANTQREHPDAQIVAVRYAGPAY